MDGEPRRRRHYGALLLVVAILAMIILLFVFLYGKLKVADAERRARESNATSRVVALVAVEPCAYLVERVAGNAADVAVLTPKGKSPEDYAPTPSQLAQLSATRLFFTVGLPIEERFTSKILELARDAKVVDLTVGVDTLEDECGHEDGAHEDDAIDPHLWTSPEIARHMVRQIADAFAALDPVNESNYRANAAALDAELEELQRSARAKLDPYRDRIFIVYHPAYGYFAREFHITQRAIEVNGKAPRPKELEALVSAARESGARAIIVQPEFNRSSAQTVADMIGAELIDHSPLEKDYFHNMTSLIDAVVESMGRE